MASESQRTSLPDSPSTLLRRLAVGDEKAADQVFHRYATRLTALARRRLSKQLAARLDPDDVVMSAYRSFFVRARQGAFTLDRGGDLWRLLVEITLHKLYRQSAFHTAKRRSARAESGGSDALRHFPGRIPLPDVAVAAAEEIEGVMAQLNPEARAALEMRLQGYQLREIATALHRSERTIRRWLDDCKKLMRNRFPALTLAQPRERNKKGPKFAARRTKAPPLDVDATLAFDDFILQRQIGTGTTGKVYLALDKRSNSSVAVKFLRKRFLKHPEVIARFQQEARLLQQLNHPGIVRMHGLGRTPNRGLFIAMNYLAQGDLAKRLTAGPIAPCDAIRWLNDAARAIEFAHQRDVIHCDLKPSNLLLGDDDCVAITDFGLARTLTSDLFGDDYIAGSPAFMAPEQIEASWGPLSPRTDVYGLGAVLYTLLAGQPPHTGSAIEVLAEIASGQPPHIPMHWQPELSAICRRCLSARSEDRYSTAAALQAELASVATRLAELEAN